MHWPDPDPYAHSDSYSDRDSHPDADRRRGRRWGNYGDGKRFHHIIRLGGFHDPARSGCKDR